jgi:undecaprenyl-diphosphatase
MIDIPQILILAVIQGAAELLPVSSSAHVIVAEKLMGLDPTTPAMTLLLVMLHTGTMFAVIIFFWRSWKENFFKSSQVFWQSMKLIMAATLATGVVGLLLKNFIEKTLLKGHPHAEIESIFGNLLFISIALASVGLLIIYSGVKKGLKNSALGLKAAWIIGMVQGLCLPFRGFSRSGATISAGLLVGIEKRRAEDFSFALAVVLTPPIILREVLRLLKAEAATGSGGKDLVELFLPSLIGMILSFISGFLALKWLSRWLEAGRWYLFGIYCLFASLVILWLHFQGL